MKVVSEVHNKMVLRQKVSELLEKKPANTLSIILSSTKKKKSIS